jgi:dTDP-4-amino-4,6-dideoxygalactose transaminase
VTVPFLDLKSQYLSIKDEIQTAISNVLESTSFAGGPFVKKFEEEFAAYCQSEYAIGCGSGTDALQLALAAAGIGEGDEVITVPNTFIATAEAICLCGAQPVFIDIDPKTCTMDPELIEGAITDKTKALIPVHLYGQTADMDPILAIAAKHKLIVIEDACQAHGAEYKGKKAGSMGDMGCFSFYPGKNLGAYGEAGAVITNNQALSQMIQMYRDHGQNRKYYHEYMGWNGRMDGIQGAILSVKLRHLDSWTESRIAHAQLYNQSLKAYPEVLTPYRESFNRHIYHIYAIRINNRDQVLEKLKEAGISTGIHYPVPIHLQNAFNRYKKETNSFPNSEKCSLEELSLPMYAELTGAQIEYVVQKIIQSMH